MPRYGTAVREIELALPVPLQGHLGRVDHAESVLDPLSIRSVFIEISGRSFTIIALDALSAAPEITHEIRAGLKQGRNAGESTVIVAATHTHTAPATIHLGTTEPDERYVSQIVTLGIECARESETRAENCRLRFIENPVNRFAMNRRADGPRGIEMCPDPAGSVDPMVSVLLFESLKSRRSCSLTVLAMHPTTLGLSVNRVSADYPGRLRDRIEGALGSGHTAVVLQGAAADTKPILSPAAKQFPEGNERTIDTIALELSRSIENQIADAPLLAARRLGVRRTVLRAGFDYSAQRTWEVSGAGYSLAAAHIPGNPLRAFSQVWNESIACSPERAKVHEPLFELFAVSFGTGPAFVFLPFEPFSFTARRIRGDSPFQSTITVGYANAGYGYVPPLCEIERGGYECEQAYRFYRMPFPFHPGTEESVRKAVIAELTALYDENSPGAVHIRGRGAARRP